MEVTVIFDNKEHLVKVPSDQSILDASLNQYVDLPYSCQSGICGSCMAKLVSGEVIIEADDALSQEDIDKGYILACQARPKGDGVILDYED